MTKVEELEAKAQKIRTAIDWIDPKSGNHDYVGGLMPPKIALGFVFLRVELNAIEKEIKQAKREAVGLGLL